MALPRPLGRERGPRRVSDVTSDAKTRAKLQEEVGRRAQAAAGQLFTAGRGSGKPPGAFTKKALEVDSFLRSVVGDEVDIAGPSRGAPGARHGSRRLSLEQELLAAGSSIDSLTAFQPFQSYNSSADPETQHCVPFIAPSGGARLTSGQGLPADSTVFTDLSTLSNGTDGDFLHSRKDLPPVRPKSRLGPCDIIIPRASVLSRGGSVGLSVGEQENAHGEGVREAGRNRAVLPRHSLTSTVPTLPSRPSSADVDTVGFRSSAFLRTT